MENADALDLSKENIQPLKRGRNTTQLGLALQAQTDTTLHQMLSKKQEWYEMQIRSYEGIDPLELWCEYISWVEQSFPKHGPEGNLSVLLTKCFQAFKDEEKYKNDTRFVRLWTKYIEMQNDGKRVELYQVLHSQGIGIRCAEFYRCWAYEYECAGDWKQADQIYRKGSSFLAQPAEELHAAYQQFMASYVFNHKNDIPEEEADNNVQGDHRLPMAALKPVGKKSAAPNVRVGSNVRSQAPGVVPSIQGPSGRPISGSRTFGVRGNNAGPVAVYQQLEESEAEPLYGQVVPSAVPIPQTLNKENIVKAGPWTGQSLGSRKHQSTSVVHSIAPRTPGFEVHKDDGAEVAGGHGVIVPNVLKPRKALEDGFHDAIAIFEDPNPFAKPMYRKNEVYAGGKELQLEELHALDYFRQRAERKKKLREAAAQLEQAEQNALHQKKMSAIGNAQLPGSVGMIPHADFSPRDVHGSYYGDRQMMTRHIQDISYRQPCPPAIIESSLNNYHQSQAPPLYESSTASESPIHYNSEVIHHEQPPHGHKFQQSNQSMYNQSMTLHTKLAMHEVNDFWRSPTVVKAEPTLPVPHAGNMYQQPAFQIMKDDSLPHQITENPPRNVFPTNNLGCSQSTSMMKISQADHNQPITVYPVASSNNYVHGNLFEDPMTVTSFNRIQNGFQVYPDEQCPPVNPLVPRGKFEVFCDEDSNNVPSRTASSERGDLSSSAHTSGSVQKVAKEKENIHKFPQADFELMEECGVNQLDESPSRGMQHPNHYQATPRNEQVVYFNQHQLPVHHAAAVAHEMMHVAPQVGHSTLPTNPTPMYETMLSAAVPVPHGTHLTGPLSNQNFEEPMDDDAPVASGPEYGVNMSETGITEAFFYPNMPAASTPFQTSPKKSRAAKNSIDVNSSLYRVEQSWPDEEENGPEGSKDSPKTVPPLKLFRIKNDEEKQLSTIMEASKERHQNTLLSNASSRNSLGSNSAMIRHERLSIAPQQCLNQIDELSEQSCINLESQAQVSVLPQIPAPSPAVVPGPDPQQMNEMAARLARGEANPFDARLLTFFLHRMRFPLPHHADGYVVVNGAVPAKRNNCLNLNGDVYNIVKTLGEGAYAKVLKGVNVNSQKEVALKIQKPSCRWEYYICQEIQDRLSERNLVSAFMPASKIYVYNNGSVIVTDLLPFGTLLNLVNKVVASTKRQMQEIQVLFLLNQLMSAVAALHRCKIIHGDLKPDNILIKSVPSFDDVEPCIQLIDFGRSIDMTLMPDGTTFDQIVMTDTFTCIEMRTGKPWTYQTDLFGLANTAHCLLLGEYMKVQENKSTGRWAIQSRLQRHLNSNLWGPFFDTLLNIESCDAIPDLERLRADIQGSMTSSSNVKTSISAIRHILLSR